MYNVEILDILIGEMNENLGKFTEKSSNEQEKVNKSFVFHPKCNQSPRKTSPSPPLWGRLGGGFFLLVRAKHSSLFTLNSSLFTHFSLFFLRDSQKRLIFALSKNTQSTE